MFVLDRVSFFYFFGTFVLWIVVGMRVCRGVERDVCSSVRCVVPVWLVCFGVSVVGGFWLLGALGWVWLGRAVGR